MRTLAEINDDIGRCKWLRTHLRDLGDVAIQDRTLARLYAERDAVVAKEAA